MSIQQYGLPLSQKNRSILYSYLPDRKAVLAIPGLPVPIVPWATYLLPYAWPETGPDEALVKSITDLAFQPIIQPIYVNWPSKMLVAGKFWQPGFCVIADGIHQYVDSSLERWPGGVLVLTARMKLRPGNVMQAVLEPQDNWPTAPYCCFCPIDPKPKQFPREWLAIAAIVQRLKDDPAITRTLVRRCILASNEKSRR